MKTKSRLLIYAAAAVLALATIGVADAARCPRDEECAPLGPQAVSLEQGFTTGVPHGADFMGANVGQRITYTKPLNPALLAFITGRDIQPTNLLRDGDCLPGQELTSGKLGAGYACWLAQGLYNAQR